MAYKADIEIAVRGARQLKDLQNEIERTSKAVDQINQALNSVNDKTAVTFNSLSRTLSDARQAFDNAARGTSSFGDAINTLIKTEREYNNELRERNSLLAQARAAQTAAARTISPGLTGFSAEKFGPQVPAGTGRQGDPAFPSSPVAERLSQQLRDQAKLKASLLALDEKSAAAAQERLRLSTQLKEELTDITIAGKTGPRVPEGFSSTAGRESVRRKQIMQEGAEFVAQEEAKRKAAIEGQNKVAEFAKKNEAAVFGIKAKNIRRTFELAVDRILEEAKVKNKALDEDFKKQKEINKNTLADFDKRLDTEVSAKKQAAKDVRKAEKKIEDQAFEQRKANRKKLDNAISSGLIGGAFPLLFGQGGGAAIGGGIGGFAGGLAGGQMGFALSLVGTQIGAFVDQLVSGGATLGRALNPLTADIDALAEAAGYANTEISNHIKTIETLGDKNRALEIATEQLTRTVGADGVDAMRRFGDASKDLANSTAQAMSQAFATIAAALGPLTRAAADFMEAALAVGQAQTSTDPRLKAVRGEIKERMKTFDNEFGGMNNLENRQKIRELRREELFLIERINVEQQISIESEAKKLKLKRDVEALNVKTPKQLELARRLLEVGNDLTNKRVVGLMEQLIQENFIVTTQRELKKMVDANIDSQTIILKLKEIELDRDEEIVELRNRINSALGKGVKNNEKTAEQKARELEQAQDLAKEFQREIRLRELNGDTARKLLEIQFEHENVVKQINNLENQSLAVEQKISAEKLKQLKINETLAKFATTRTEGEQSRDDINRENNLLAARLQGREEEFLLNERIKELGEDFINDLEVQKALQDRIAAKDFAGSQETEIKRLEAKINGTEEQFNLEQKIQAIRDLGLSTGTTELLINEQKIVDLTEQLGLIEKQKALYEQVGQTIKAGIVNGIMSAIDGSKSLSESLSGLLRQVGGIFLQAGVSSLGQSLKIPGFAEGGYVTGATPAVIGEGGEPEYVIPESKMRTAMSRYSRGSRGNSVIPESGAAETTGGGGGTAVAAPIDVRYTVERINSVDYVTADQFQTGMQQAAQQGAKQGEQQTLKRLQMSGSTRKRVGI